MNIFPQLTEDQRDCLQEIANVAMGQAGDVLARLLGTFVTLSVPKIGILVPAEVRQFISADSITVACQSFYNISGQYGLRGEALTVFDGGSFHGLAELLDYEQSVMTSSNEQELLLDIANVLNGACLTGIADQLGEELFFGAPSILKQNTQNMQGTRLLQHEQLQWKAALSVEIDYRLEKHAFHCELLLLMPDSAIDWLITRLTRFLEEM